MKRIIYTRPDGGLSVVIPAQEGDIGIAASMAKLPVSAINPQIVDSSILPVDRTFRNAWRQNGANVQVDLTIARTLTEKEIETRRRVKIRDILEREALGEDVVLEKARLRGIDARAIVDAIQTVEALKAEMAKV